MEFRPAVEADAPAIAQLALENDLLLDGLTPAIFERMLRWLYEESPPGVRIQFLADEGGVPIAHYGALPLRYRVYGEVWLAGFGSNLVIARDKRAGMTFYAIQGHLKKVCRAKGLRFSYGLVTRDGVLEPHRRAGWKLMGAIPVYAKPINIARAVRTRVRNAVLSRILAPPLYCIDALLKAFDALKASLLRNDTIATKESDFSGVSGEALEALAAPFRVAAVRDAATLRWRFLTNRDRRYEIFIARRAGTVVGYAVARHMLMRGHSALALVDVAFDPSDRRAGAVLVAACTAEARHRKVDLIATILNPSSPLLPTLRRNGYIRTPEKFSLVVQALGPSEGGVLAGAFKDWHITWFDHDYV